MAPLFSIRRRAVAQSRYAWELLDFIIFVNR
jgi:hypothetical protein